MTPAPSYNAYETSGWSDPTAAWTDEPAAAWAAPEPDPQASSITASLPAATETVQKVSPVLSSSEGDDQYGGSGDQQDWGQPAPEQQDPLDAGAGGEQNEAAIPVDGTQMVGKICRAVYPFQAQNPDELEMAEEEQLTIISASDQDWVTAQNAQGTSYHGYGFTKLILA